MLERERIIEIVVAVSSVFLMLGAMMFIGSEYGGADSALSPEGGELLVGVIVGFILLLTAVGFVLAYLLNDPADGLDEDADAQNAA
ncbi:DUF7472 family protein [Natronococcus occultus]|uniref:Transporter n=1 Tax=Natronococcus occultus SP4 TaxID=694430 RepID=L0K3L7_9EURY|nr:hypothetical protein [Natronococcus occultus]AGB39616.1 hypothetical protein Natoc_3917 [Natronococcus occultus SP4]